MPESPDLMTKLKASSNEVQQYVSALKAENAKLHRRIAQLEAENVSLENRIAAIKEGTPLAENDVSKEELEAKLVQAVREMGYTVAKNPSV